jgi:hypothetical protein
MEAKYVRDDYEQYYLYVHSEILFPEHGFALVAPDGFVYEGGIGISNWTVVSEARIPYGVWRRFECQREILEEREAELEVELETEN